MPAFIPLAISIALPIGVGVAGSLFSSKSIKDWYPTLRKPSWVPSPRVFGPIWTTLYTLMGVSAYRVWRTVGLFPGAPWLAYGLQLALNGVWNPVFFAAKRIDIALADIAALLVAGAWCAVEFAKIDAVAGALLLPYLGWAAFATALNYKLLVLNPNAGRGQSSAAEAEALAAADKQDDDSEGNE